MRAFIDIGERGERRLRLHCDKPSLWISRDEIDWTRKITIQRIASRIAFDLIMERRKLCWAQGSLCGNPKIVCKMLREIWFIFEVSLCDIATVESDRPIFGKCVRRELIYRCRDIVFIDTRIIGVESTIDIGCLVDIETSTVAVSEILEMLYRAVVSYIFS